MADPKVIAWWRRTALLAAAVVVVWTVVGLLLQILDLAISRRDMLGLPLAYLLAAIVAPLVMAVVLFLYIPWQRAIDRRVDGGEG